MFSRKYLLFLLFPIIELFYSCKEDIIEDPTIVSIDKDIKWIYNKMKDSYLWQNEIKKITDYQITSDAQDFFSQLISMNETKKQAVATSTSGDTLYRYYYYSYMEEDPNFTKAQDGTINTYGIDYLLYSVKDSNPVSYAARVLYVYPNSPAMKAGIKRGMWILNINGEKITNSNYQKLDNGDSSVWNIYYGDLKLGEANFTANIDASQNIENTPIIEHKILDDGASHKVGYLAYNHFSTGPDGFEDKKWDNDLMVIFSDFKKNQVNELVIDLRYNPGGYLSCAQLLSSFVIPSNKFGEVLCRLTYNNNLRKRNTSIFFDNSVKSSYNLNLSRVYILTGEWTASASEVVLNGLKGSGIMTDVIQIGYTTEGKNLASEEIKEDGYKWILHPIMAYVANKDNFGDYSNGITPEDKFFIDEADTRTYTKAWLPLGDENELLLNMALVDIGYVMPPQPDDQMTKAKKVEDINNMYPVFNSISNRKEGGIIVKF